MRRFLKGVLHLFVEGLRARTAGSPIKKNLYKGWSCLQGLTVRLDVLEHGFCTYDHTTAWMSEGEY